MSFSSQTLVIPALQSNSAYCCAAWRVRGKPSKKTPELLSSAATEHPAHLPAGWQKSGLGLGVCIAGVRGGAASGALKS